MFITIAFVLSLAYAAPSDCETRIGGLSDKDFLGRVTHALDEFWRPRLDAGLGEEELGLTGDIRDRFTPWHMPHHQPTVFRPGKIVIYADSVWSPAGPLGQRTSPFYNPDDETIYISAWALRTHVAGYFNEAATWAYLLAHEYGHHVQNTVGLFKLSARMKPAHARDFALRRELQADCLAGVWLHHHAAMFDDAEIAAIKRVVARIADRDHGTSAQRRAWLERGIATGDPRACDTFSPLSL